MQGTNDHVESQPNDDQPTCPIAAVQHKDAGDNLGSPGKMDHPMFLEVGNPLSSAHMSDWQQPCDQCNGAEDYEQPADYGD